MITFRNQPIDYFLKVKALCFSEIPIGALLYLPLSKLENITETSFPH